MKPAHSPLPKPPESKLSPKQILQDHPRNFLDCFKKSTLPAHTSEGPSALWRPHLQFLQSILSEATTIGPKTVGTASHPDLTCADS